MSDTQKLGICAVGIFVCYFVFGILQEKITRGRYGDEINDDGTKGERFTFTLALVGVQCLCNWIFAKGMLCYILCSFCCKSKNVVFLLIRDVDNETTSKRWNTFILLL